MTYRSMFVVVACVMACGEVVKQAEPDASGEPCPPGMTCECTIATQATDCGAHEVCNESGGNRICECAVAYTEVDGVCSFTGGIADPGFQDPSKWTVEGGVMVLPTAPGSAQPGELSLTPAATCAFGTAKQTIMMPPFDRADPLKLTITYKLDDPNFEFTFNGRIQVGVGNQWMEVAAPFNSYQTSSFCLGSTAFGGPVEVQIGALGSPCPAQPNTMVSLRVDQVKLEVAKPGDCPRSFGVVNGGFQLATGWKFLNTQSGAGQILPDIGENGSFAARLTQPNRCSEVTAVGTISIPTATEVPNPALDVYWNGTSGARLAVRLGGSGIGTLNANGQIKHSRLCLPKWATGNITSLEFFAQRLSNNNCTVALNRTFILDNMTVVDEPACGALADLTDPGFERIADAMGPMPGWALSNGYVNDLEGARALVLNSASNASSGNGVLRTSSNNPCVSVGQAGADVAFEVPAPEGNAGPAVKFMARAAANPQSETRAQLRSMTSTLMLGTLTVSETGAYTSNTLCIPAKLAGRRLSVRLTTGTVTGGACASPYPEEFGFFDDVAITTDASCPAQ